MEVSLVSIIVIIAAGTAAGFINVVAGGGSLITVPTLIFLGIPPVMANGTNRIAILSQNALAVGRFRQKGYFPWKAGLTLGITAAAGALAGSMIAVEISGELFSKILSGVMIMVLILTLLGNKRKQAGDEIIRRWWLLVPVFFLVGIYGGFIQAGVGFIIIAAFSLISGTNLVMTNAIKVMVVFLYTIPSLIIFIINGEVAWIAGIALAVGNATGGWLGAHFSVQKGDKWIKVILTVTVLAMAVRLFFFS
ncbi:sulfite exporter TauE/SafE family protein [Salinispira pacifica]|uniref:Probable membrane transporter protein n=1 Tax=Salinispira pacifica TaxID=1307761 RepID=V5WJV2_9SPIO|nr:sulfite exporter TauE/SafE family protein [Salinispira pacifica]AHC15940.1 Membrane protein, putative [Salinispira pacifica]